MDFETPDPELEVSTPDRAGAPHTFRGRELEQFSIRRQLAAQAMGNQLLSGCARLPEGGAYPGMFLDIVVLIFLCQCPIPTVLRALRRPSDVQEEALTWAEAQGISIGSAAFTEAIAVYSAILNELQSAQFRVVETAAGTALKNAGGALPTGA